MQDLFHGKLLQDVADRFNFPSTLFSFNDDSHRSSSEAKPMREFGTRGSMETLGGSAAGGGLQTGRNMETRGNVEFREDVGVRGDLGMRGEGEIRGGRLVSSLPASSAMQSNLSCHVPMYPSTPLYTDGDVQLIGDDETWNARMRNSKTASGDSGMMVRDTGAVDVDKMLDTMSGEQLMKEAVKAAQRSKAAETQLQVILHDQYKRLLEMISGLQDLSDHSKKASFAANQLKGKVAELLEKKQRLDAALKEPLSALKEELEKKKLQGDLKARTELPLLMDKMIEKEAYTEAMSIYLDAEPLSKELLQTHPDEVARLEEALQERAKTCLDRIISDFGRLDIRKSADLVKYRGETETSGPNPFSTVTQNKIRMNFSTIFRLLTREADEKVWDNRWITSLESAISSLLRSLTVILFRSVKKSLAEGVSASADDDSESATGRPSLVAQAACLFAQALEKALYGVHFLAQEFIIAALAARDGTNEEGNGSEEGEKGGARQGEKVSEYEEVAKKRGHTFVTSSIKEVRDVFFYHVTRAVKDSMEDMIPKMMVTTEIETKFDEIVTADQMYDAAVAPCREYFKLKVMEGCVRNQVDQLKSVISLHTHVACAHRERQIQQAVKDYVAALTNLCDSHSVVNGHIGVKGQRASRTANTERMTANETKYVMAMSTAIAVNLLEPKQQDTNLITQLACIEVRPPYVHAHVHSCSHSREERQSCARRDGYKYCQTYGHNEKRPVYVEGDSNNGDDLSPVSSLDFLSQQLHVQAVIFLESQREGVTDEPTRADGEESNEGGERENYTLAKASETHEEAQRDRDNIEDLYRYTMVHHLLETYLPWIQSRARQSESLRWNPNVLQTALAKTRDNLTDQLEEKYARKVAGTLSVALSPAVLSNHGLMRRAISDTETLLADLTTWLSDQSERAQTDHALTAAFRFWLKEKGTECQMARLCLHTHAFMSNVTDISQSRSTGTHNQKLRSKTILSAWKFVHHNLFAQQLDKEDKEFYESETNRLILMSTMLTLMAVSAQFLFEPRPNKDVTTYLLGILFYAYSTIHPAVQGVDWLDWLSSNVDVIME